jgi:hypothetical protein
MARYVARSICYEQLHIKTATKRGLLFLGRHGLPLLVDW